MRLPMEKNIRYFAVFVLIALFMQTESAFGMLTKYKPKSDGSKGDPIRKLYGKKNVGLQVICEPEFDLAALLVCENIRKILFKYLLGNLQFIKSAALTNKRMLATYNELLPEDKKAIESCIRWSYRSYYNALPSSSCYCLSFTEENNDKFIAFKESKYHHFLHPTKRTTENIMYPWCLIPIAEVIYRCQKLESEIRQLEHTYGKDFLSKDKEKGDLLKQEVARNLAALDKCSINYPIWGEDWKAYDSQGTKDLLAQNGWTYERLAQENPVKWCDTWCGTEDKPKNWDVYLQLKKIDSHAPVTVDPSSCSIQ
jgi:hypothetical protein